MRQRPEAKRAYDKEYWKNMSKEKKAKHNAECNARREKKRIQDTMLTQFLRAETPAQKRAVIKSFAPHYFIFGTKLDPNPTKENDDEL